MKIKHTQQVDFSNPNADKITSGVTNKPIKKETAIEWLIDKLMDEELLWIDGKPDNSYTLIEIIKKAKAMFEEQIIEAHDEARTYVLKNVWKHDDGKRYYQEIYEK